ncbi:MAG: 3-hydroxyacyl-CoA dehydrogenase family protein [Halobacteriovoraceae bacterium]|nr:3-hydroxyacyl-CoA dehydrogenase family protein [Halobacteriovoraceae bacterium]
MNDCFILTTSNHPLFDELSRLDIPFYEKLPENPLPVAFDFTITDLREKERTLKFLSDKKCSIISDLGPYWGDDLMRRYPAIKGAFAASFPSLQKKIEVHSPCEKSMKLLEELLGKLDMSSLVMEEAGVGFYYPRIPSLIINDAYFAKQEKLAEEDAVDTAMKYGVNYPQGPFEWTKKIGAFSIKLLLEELYRATKDARYMPADALLEEAKRRSV